HLITAALDLRNAAQGHTAGAGVVDKARDVAHAVADQGHGASRKRRHYQFAVTFRIAIDDFEEEVELIDMVSLANLAFHAQAAAGLRGTVTEYHGGVPHLLNVVTIHVCHAIARRHDHLHRYSTLGFGNFAEADQPGGIGNNHVVSIERQPGVKIL